MNDRGSNGTGSWRIQVPVRRDTAKLTNVRVTGFGESCNLVRKSKMFVKDEAKVSSRVGGVKWGVVYFVYFVCKLKKFTCLAWTSLVATEKKHYHLIANFIHRSVYILITEVSKRSSKSECKINTLCLLTRLTDNSYSDCWKHLQTHSRFTVTSLCLPALARGPAKHLMMAGVAFL